MAQTGVATPQPFAQGGGELGKLIDEFDWGATSLGPLAGWPPLLRNTVALILRSPAPMVSMWGEDGVMIYNDGYARIAAERHPQQLGVPVRESWPDEAAFNDNVMRVCMAGGTLSYPDAELCLRRADGLGRTHLDVLERNGRNGMLLLPVARLPEDPGSVGPEQPRDDREQHDRRRSNSKPAVEAPHQYFCEYVTRWRTASYGLPSNSPGVRSLWMTSTT